MSQPAYVAIAGEFARRIRSGELPPGSQLPSYAEIARANAVSDIVVRKALELLQGQGLVRTVRRRGVFVSARPTLVRISPERQLEDPEDTFGNESSRPIEVLREERPVRADASLADQFGIVVGDTLLHTLTRVSEGGTPVSISDTYQPSEVRDLSEATTLEETISDRLPSGAHSAWLGVAQGDLVKQIHQRFLSAEGKLLMLSDVSYPRDRYDAFVFRMVLRD